MYMKAPIMKEKAWQDIEKLKRSIDKDRLQLSGLSSELLRISKRAIFALQRSDDAEAKSRLKKADELLKSGLKIVSKQPSTRNEGIWRAAIEEYAEAYIFNSFLEGKLKYPPALKDYPDAIYGGLADAAGEMARLSVLSATAGDTKTIERAHEITVQIVEHLAMLELTSALRSKFDQSKSHLRRIEDIRYDMSKR
jgi:predicted translin family RNA/ssDNA-binding protein